MIALSTNYTDKELHAGLKFVTNLRAVLLFKNLNHIQQNMKMTARIEI